MFTASLLPFLALTSMSIALDAAGLYRHPTISEASLDARAQVYNAKNCLRAVRASTATAMGSSYCQSFLSTTFTATVTSYSTLISTPAAPTITFIVGTTTQTVGILCTSTSTSVSLATVTSIDLETAATTVFVKRAATTPFSASVASACPSSSGITQASRISSACSCFLAGSASTPTVYSTTTISSTAPVPPAVTVTSSFLSTSTISTCSAYSTDIVVSTFTTTATSATVSSSTSTSTTSVPVPTCRYPGTCSTFYTGVSITESSLCGDVEICVCGYDAQPYGGTPRSYDRANLW